MRPSSSHTTDFPTQPALTLTEPRRSRPLNPALRERLMLQLSDLHAQVEHAYPAFAAEVRELLPDKAHDSVFGYVVRRLWREDAGELPADWRAGLRSRYENFVNIFGQTLPCDWSEQKLALVKRTLSVWQPRYVLPLAIKDAVEMIGNVQRVFASEVMP